MEFLAGPLLMFGVFLALYELLRRREERRRGRKPPVQWGWLVAIAGAAGLALLIGAVTR